MRVDASVERSTEIAAEPAAVWAVVSDVERMGELMPEVERYEPVEAGWRFVMAEQHRFGQRFQPRFTVRYEFDAPDEVRFERVAGAGDSAGAGGRVAIGAAGGSGTRLSFRLDLTVELGLPGLFRGPVRAMLDDELRRLADGFLDNVRTASQ